MTLAGDSIVITPGSGATVATHTVGGKEHQVIMQADPDGHLHGTAAAYVMTQQPRVTTAAATDFFDLFNATGSGKIIRIRGIWIAVQITAASAIVPSFHFEVRRTTAVGTGGTVASFETTGTPAAGAVNISRFSTLDATLPAQITARSLPTGGATAGAHLFPIYTPSEETNAAVYLSQQINWLFELPYYPPVELQENQGFKIRQITATASTGTNLGWQVAFVVIP